MSSLRKVESPNLLKIIEKFYEPSILVLGDVILDQYIWGRVDRICPEAPVPVVEVERESMMLGGAANVVNNLSSLGAKVSLCGVVGADPSAQEIKKRLQELDASAEGLIVEPGRPTSTKTRIVAGHQQVVRFDHETKAVILPATTRKIYEFLETNWESFQAIIISDYAKGVIDEGLLQKILKLNRQKPKLICVDPKEKNMGLYKGVSLITPNKKEAAFAAGQVIESEEDLIKAGQKIIQKLQCENLVITLGSEGMALFKRSGEFIKIPTFAREVFDVSGAGDTVVSVLTLALACGAALSEAVALANFAAGVVVGKIGTASVTPEELKKYIRVEKNRVSTEKFSSYIRV